MKRIRALASLDRKEAKTSRAGRPARDVAARREEGKHGQNHLWQTFAMRPFGIQRKLSVSQPDDPHEKEADRVADRVMRMPVKSANRGELPVSAETSKKAQRKCDRCEEEEEKKLYLKEEGGAIAPTATAPPLVHEALSSSGQPLDPATRNFFEPRFGYDFSRVRVHTGGLASASARTLGATAFTIGSDIVFKEHRYSPATQEGRRLLAHELTHVAQSEHIGSGVIHRQHDEDEGRTIVREGLRQYTQEMRFSKVINDCPANTGVRLLDVLMRIRGRIDGNTQCLEFFRRRLGTDPIPLLSPYRGPSFTIDPSLTTSGHTRCAPSARPGHPQQPEVIRLGQPLCTSPHLDRIIMHELAHQTGCLPTGRPAAWDEAVANQASDLCIGSVQEQLRLRDQAAALNQAASPEDWNFTSLDLVALQQRQMQLRFDSDSAWFPEPLRENLRNTLIYLLAPRMSEPRTEGVNTTDLFHGHVVVPRAEATQALLSQRDAWSRDLVNTRRDVLGSEGRVTDENLSAYVREIGRLALSSRPLLAAVIRIPNAAIIYHTFEFPAPGSPQAQIRAGSPRRNFRTPISTNVPAPYAAPDPDNASSYQQEYTHIFQFSFLVDRDGVIHVRPDFGRELSGVVGRPLNR